MSEQTYPRDAEPLRIDIVSDVVCPWCIVGFKQLQSALALTSITATIHWHPFELNPHMAEAGENLRDHLRAKYGTSAEDSVKIRAHITAMGAELGFVFDFSDDMRMVNTFRAHQLLHWAQGLGRQHDLKMALFAAYFTDRRNIDDPTVLADVAAGIGLDGAAAAAVLDDAPYARDVRQEMATWTARGITGVPAMVFDQNHMVFDQNHLVVGAQGVDKYAVILQQLAKAVTVPV